MNLTGTAFHPDFGEAVNYRAIPLSSDPDTQVAQMIGHMRLAAIEDSGSEPIQRDAANLQSGSGDHCSDTFWFNKGRVGFQRDEQTADPFADHFDDDVVEVMIRPRDLANMRQPKEDCDGFATYAASQLRALGVPCNFVTIAADGREPNRYSHVYLACYPNGQRVALDISHGAYPGWEAPNMFGRKKEWPIDGPDGCELFLMAAIWAGLWFLGRWSGIL